MPDNDKTVGIRKVEELGDTTVTGILTLDNGTTNSQANLISTTDGTLSISGPGPAGTSLLLSSTVLWLEVDTAPIVGLRASDLTPFGVVAVDLGSSTAGYRDLYLDGSVKGASVSASTFDPLFAVLAGTTQPSVGTGAAAIESGLYTQMGGQVQGNITVRWSTNGAAGNGTYGFTPPKAVHSALGAGGIVGEGRLYDHSVTDSAIVVCRKSTSTGKIDLLVSSTSNRVVTNANPFALGAANDRIDLNLHYLTTE